MRRNLDLTVVITPEDDGFVSFCPELDIASQGDSVVEARRNLQEALDLFFEVADKTEIEQRLRENEIFVSKLEVAFG
jgi:predicted RNase H-like HicB family nuclease